MGNSLTMRAGHLLLAVLALFSASGPVIAATVEDPSWHFRVGGSLGFDTWSDAGDIEPNPGDNFDDTGFSLEFNLHGEVARMGPAVILLGGDLGVFTHDSDIRGVEEGEDLALTAFYITPSVKIGFGDTRRTRFFLDAGAGYYDVAAEEMEDDCFWECDIYEYYDDSTFGGFLGASADFSPGLGEGLKIITGVKVHFVDFDEPVELDPTASLDGPIYQFHFGVAWAQ